MVATVREILKKTEADLAGARAGAGAGASAGRGSAAVAQRNEARREALLMVSHLLRISPSELLPGGDKPVELGSMDTLSEWVERRRIGEPLQYITGEVEFRGLGFIATPDVLIPRPETEHVVEEALKALKGCGGSAAGPYVLDLCSGSGCIGISIAVEVPGAEVLATDFSVAACETARKNAKRNNVGERFECLCGDMYEPIRLYKRGQGLYKRGRGPEGSLEGSFDLIVANPPYIETAYIDGLQTEVRDFEPRMALDGGSDGLEFIRRVVQGAPKFLKPGGTFVMEFGYGQGRDVEALAESTKKFKSIEITEDLSGIERVLTAKTMAKKTKARLND